MEQSIAHTRTDATGNHFEQPLSTHLLQVGKHCRRFAGAIDLPDMGELLGLLHDTGKASAAFQRYIRSASGSSDPDSDEYQTAKGLRGKIDHSTAGAQYAYFNLKDGGREGAFAAEIVALCLASHHSGLIDGLLPDGTDRFGVRMAKSDDKSHRTEAVGNLEPAVRRRIDTLLDSGAIIRSVVGLAQRIGRGERKTLREFHYGMLVKFLFSCLIDADRLDSASFDDPAGARLRSDETLPDWDRLIERLARKLAKFEVRNRVDEIRRMISDACKDGGRRQLGAYALTVPTGGGKTLASLRFALHHARTHQLDRIIYAVPFTSIIDQNAQQVREIMEGHDGDAEDEGLIVLEHHSNLTPEEDTWQRKVLSVNWDAPIVFTTNVQILEALFGSGTRNARRLHQLSRSVLIFDEVQALPINSVHLFNNAINFLVQHCGSTALMCTATQPLLDRVDEERGALRLSGAEHEIVRDTRTLFKDLRRVEISDQRRANGWEFQDIARLAKAQLEKTGSVLTIVNTKAAARKTYEETKQLFDSDVSVSHLSANMCPAHRMVVLDQVRRNLDDKRPMVCVSTQVIEAGVDVDFGTVIRSLAGLDSIAQAAGRCNRNGLRPGMGEVIIVNPNRENSRAIRDISLGMDAAKRVLDEFSSDPAMFGHDLLGPKAMDLYYRYYFWTRKDVMHYPVGEQSGVGREDSLLNLLGTNGTETSGSVGEHVRVHGRYPDRHFRQSFMVAAREFKPIDTVAQGVIVPWGDGEGIIAELLGSYESHVERTLLRSAQRYSVGTTPGVRARLEAERAIQEIGDTGMIALIDCRWYSDEFGLTPDAGGPMPYLES